ncbi:MAG: type IV pilus biogenesis/stability protein PilW [Enterovibrio sp.]
MMARMQLKKSISCGVLLCFSLAGCMRTTIVDGKTANQQDVAQARINLGLAYLEQGEWPRARQNLEAAVAAAPKYTQARMAFAYYLQQVGENEQALKQYRTALSAEPKNPELLHNYATFLCHTGHFAKAQKAFLDAIAQPRYYNVSSSYESAALCALKANDRPLARKWFVKAIAHEPNRYISTLYLINMDIDDKKTVQAQQRLMMLQKQYGDQPSSLLAWIRLNRDQPAKIKQHARLLAEKFPQSKEYRQYLANEY